ncbi:MAG TPA: glycoside hydrolase family 88 protein [Tepidisphaeraceae bacterium]|nr:glycoside hydrolase family 88 protein [Tepidisphaeraceae bacterium]
MLRRSLVIVSALLLLSACASSRGAKSSVFNEWPEGKSPREVGQRVAQRFLEVPYQNAPHARPPRRVIYPEVCTWYGALTFAKQTNDDALRQQLVARFQPLLGERRNMIPPPDHVDNTVFAAVPLELYMQTREQRYLDLAKPMVDGQWGQPTGRGTTQPQAHEWARKGFTWQTRLWIDDMYMITAAQAQAYRATGDRAYLDRAAKEMVLYLDELQRPNGLFFHAPDVPFFWGRGDGWVAAGMAELLRDLPADHPDRPRIMKGYHLMMAALLKHQDKSGMWRQLIDDPQAWPETSCTGMFTFAFITGVKNGWLDAKTYGPAARRGWMALTDYIEPDGDVREVCEGTNKRNDRQFYLDRRRITGDMHGQAPVLWCATALLRDETRSAPPAATTAPIAGRGR